MDDAEHARRVQDRLNQGSDEILKGEHWDEVRRLPADELAVRHDACLIMASNVIGTDVKTMYLEQAQVYGAERTRRETDRQGQRMETLTRSLNRLTKWIVVLTVIVVIATIIGVVLTAWAVLFGG